MSILLNQSPVIHIRFDGRSVDVPTSQIGITADSADADIRKAVARYLEVPAERLSDSVLDRHASGNLTIRPSAVFG